MPAVKVLQDGEFPAKSQAQKVPPPVAHAALKNLPGVPSGAGQRGRPPRPGLPHEEAEAVCSAQPGDRPWRLDKQCGSVRPGVGGRIHRGDVRPRISRRDSAWDYTIGQFRNVGELGIVLDTMQDEGWEAVFAGWRKMYGGDAEAAEADQRDAAKN